MSDTELLVRAELPRETGSEPVTPQPGSCAVKTAPTTPLQGQPVGAASTANGAIALGRRLEQPHALHLVAAGQLFLEQLLLLARLDDGAFLDRAVAADLFR